MLFLHLFFWCSTLFTPPISVTSANFTLDILPPSRQEVCLGDSLHLTATSSIGNLAIIWSPDDGNILPLSDTSVAISPLQSAWYFAQASDGICEARDSIFIEVVEVILSVDTVEARCAGEPFILKANANVPGDFIWQPGDLEGEEVSVNTSDTTVYTVDFTTSCGTRSAEVVVNAAENPPINIFCFAGQDEAMLIEGNEVNLTALPDNVPGAIYSWDTGEMTSRIIATPAAPETYYEVRVTYPNGCSRVIGKGFEVSPAEAEMPNAFTPDGDGANDFFRPVLKGVMAYERFEIFNRWGNKVYDLDNPADGWDGTINGQAAASDVYLYHIILRRINGEAVNFRGNVTLIR